MNAISTKDELFLQYKWFELKLCVLIYILILEFDYNIFVNFEMPGSSYRRPIGKIHISLLFRPSVIRGPWLSYIHFRATMAAKAPNA